MSAAHDIVEFLAAQGEGAIGGGSQWSLHLGREPDTPDETVTVYDTGGGLADPDNGVYQPSIQVRVRHNDYRTAADKAEAIRDTLIASATGFTANGVKYLGAWALSDPTGLGYDEHDRARVVINFDLMYET